MVFATRRAMTKVSRSQRGNRCLRFAPRPCPVTLPMRAHIICTAAIRGQVSNAVQSSLVPSCAPATEYVAMPDGSSSAAPVITPGPMALASDRIHRDGADVDTQGRLYAQKVDWGIFWFPVYIPDWLLRFPTHCAKNAQWMGHPEFR